MKAKAREPQETKKRDRIKIKVSRVKLLNQKMPGEVVLNWEQHCPLEAIRQHLCNISGCTAWSLRIGMCATDI